GRPPKPPWQSVTAWRHALAPEGWTQLTVQEGEKGPVELDLVTRRVQTRLERKRTGPQEWLVVTQQFPPMALLSYTTLALGQSAGRFDFNWALMSMPKRPKLSASQAENLPQVSSGHTTPMTHGKRHVIGLRSQTGEQGLRGIRKDH